MPVESADAHNFIYLIYLKPDVIRKIPTGEIDLPQRKRLYPAGDPSTRFF